MSGPVDRSRRAFLTGRAEEPALEPRLVPSPPWLADRISATICNACAGPCVDACPDHIIRLHPESHCDAGLAYLDFSESHCTFCRACTDVCPEISAPATTNRALPPVAIDATSCLAAQGVVCVICVARCPERALRSHPGGSVVVTAESCSGCGACISACPTNALGIPAAD
jgi:ferredoxin-type protein NapF